MTTCFCTSNTIYGKYVDVMGQYETHLIDIFMNINTEMSKIGAKTREKIFPLKYIFSLFSSINHGEAC